MKRLIFSLLCGGWLMGGGWIRAEDSPAAEKPSVITFYDWYSVWAGGSTYQGETLQYTNAPRGIRLESQPAKRSEVFFKREMPWEQGHLGHMFVIHENGQYRMWYNASPVLTGYEDYMCYAESADGFRWNRPLLGIYEYNGSKENNILAEGDRLGLHSVFIDPTAPPQQRYKGILCSVELFRDGKRIPYTMQDKWEIRNKRKAMEVEGFKIEEIDKQLRVGKSMIQGAVSPDGIHWEVIEEPLLYPGRMDTQNIAAYDEDRGEYLFYIRGDRNRRRTVRFTGGETFGKWPAPRHVLLTDSMDPPDMDIYTTCFCREPSIAEFRMYLMFPAMYHRGNDTIEIQFAASRDRVQWTRLDRKTIIPQGSDQPGKPYGTIYASPNLVVMGDETWALPYVGNARKHNEWDWEKHAMLGPDGEYRWAMWKKQRISALVADGSAEFALVGQMCTLGRIEVNGQTEPDGWIKIGLIESCTNKGEPYKPLKGFEIENAEPLTGDPLQGILRWRGNSDVSAWKGKYVYLQVQMHKAKLFAITM